MGRVARRTQQEADATRRALLKAGRALFAREGFDAVSADAIAAEAGVTRGALHHHFEGKPGLFRAVLEETMAEVASRLVAATEGAHDPLDALERGLLAFLETVPKPTYLRILLVDGPAVLGWHEWRAIDLRHGLGLVRGALQAAAHAGRLRVSDVEATSHILAGALVDAAMLIAAHPRDRRLRADVAQTISALLRGLSR